MTAQNFRGMTLLEIFLAIFMLLLVIIPVYHHITTEAGRNIETEKIQMADKILTSIKEEMIALPFSAFYKRTEGSPNTNGPFELEDGFYPVTLNKVLEVQKNYKDFKVVGSWTYLMRNDGKVDKTMVQVDAQCIWTTSKNKPAERSRSFLLIAPK